MPKRKNHKSKMKGAGFLGDAWSFVKKHHQAKTFSNTLASNPLLNSLVYSNAYTGGLANGAKMLGFGGKKHKR